MKKNNSKKYINISIIIVIIITFTVILFALPKGTFSLEETDYTDQTTTLRQEYATYKNLPSNDVDLEVLSKKKATVTHTSNMVAGLTDDGYVYARVTSSKLKYGTQGRSDPNKLNTLYGDVNEIPGTITITFKDCANLINGEKADVRVDISNIKFKLGKKKSGYSSTYSYLKVLHLYNNTNPNLSVDVPYNSQKFGIRNGVYDENNDKAASNNIGTRNKVKITIVKKDGTPVDVSNKQMLFGMSDLDMPDVKYHAGNDWVTRYSGTYPESVALIDGVASPVVFSLKNSTDSLLKSYLTTEDLTISGFNMKKLRIRANGTKRQGDVATEPKTAPNGSFVVPANPRGFSFFWYASSWGTNGKNTASKIIDLPQVSVQASKVCPESNNECGTVTKEGKEEHNLNTTPIYEYDPEPGYKVKSLEVNGEAVDFDENGGSYQFDKLYSDPLGLEQTPEYSIKVEFEEDPVTVNYASDDYGQITGIETEEILRNHNPSGSDTTPNEGYSFIYWTNDHEVTIGSTTKPAGSHLSSSQVKQAKIIENTTFTAVHSANTLLITYESDEHGSIPSPNTESVEEGSNPLGTETVPDGGYQLVYWTCDKDVTLENGTTKEAGDPITPEELINIKVTENLTFTAVHELGTYIVTYKSDDYGTIEGSTTETLKYDGNPTGREVTPNRGYKFEKWICNKDISLEDGTTKEAGESLTDSDIKKILVKENITLTAINSPNVFKLTYESDEYGQITGQTEEEVEFNDNLVGTEEKPNEGYHTAGWICDKNITVINDDDSTREITAGDLMSYENMLAMIVEDNITCTVKHELNKYIVNYASDSNGKIEGNSKEEVLKGNTPNGTKEKPNTGYRTIGWKCNKDVELKNEEKITANKIISNENLKSIIVNEDLSCTVLHTKEIYTVSYEKTEGLTWQDDIEEVEFEGNPSNTYKLDEGYRLVGYTANHDVTLNNGKVIKKGEIIDKNSLKKIKITENLKIKAIVKSIKIFKNPYTIDKIKPYIAISILTFLGITFFVILREDRKAEKDIK